MCGDGGLGGGYEMSLFLAELNFICKSGKIKKKWKNSHSLEGATVGWYVICSKASHQKH